MTDWQKKMADWVRTACIMDVMSPKPGNVFPGHEFARATVQDFLKSAEAIAPVLARAGDRSLGETILRAVEATRSVVDYNTNLGIILLLAPLAAVPPEQSLIDGVSSVLARTTVADSVLVYRAIRKASPGGIGDSEHQDVRDEPTVSLVECMRLAADRDMVAAQYVNNFQHVLLNGRELLSEATSVSSCGKTRVAWLATRMIAEFGDTLIARRCGPQMSRLVQQRAQDVLATGWPANPATAEIFQEFDRFLREDESQKNPGTTADLVTAILFAGLREGWLDSSNGWTILPAD